MNIWAEPARILLRDAKSPCQHCGKIPVKGESVRYQRNGATMRKEVPRLFHTDCYANHRAAAKERAEAPR